jgi:RHS repeat-associated protein
VSLTYASLPTGARVQFLARSGTIACAGGNAAPTVSITSPAANATFTAPASITLTANAQDTDGTVTQVQYFANASPLGTASSSPYSFNWTNVAAGSYSLTARATDNAGASTTSSPVPITVGTAQTKLYFIHTDHLNTPRLIADEQQRTVWRWDHTDPFGGNPPDENPSGLGVFEFPLRFPGQYADRETNLHYNYFRDYDSSIGRYVQSDPVGLLGGINTYVYGDNPIGQIDPLGLMGRAPGGPGPRGPRFPGSVCGPSDDPDNNFPGNFGAWSFNKACRNHDACYAKCGKRKQVCDDEFYDDMRNACDTVPPATWGGFARLFCRDLAYDYYVAVRRSARAAAQYANAQATCNCP